MSVSEVRVPVEIDQFGGHYVEWRSRRVAEILRLFGPVEGKTVLELASGFGEIGAELEAKGAIVTYTEGRREHIAVMRGRFAHNRVEQTDLEEGIRLSRPATFDIVLHLGVLYHLTDPWPSIRDSARLGKVILLESECLPRLGSGEVEQVEEGYDQSLSGRSLRLTPASIEALLVRAGLSFARLRSPRLDTGFHVYSGRLTRGAETEIGFRRLWIAAPAERLHDAMRLLTLDLSEQEKSR